MRVALFRFDLTFLPRTMFSLKIGLPFASHRLWDCWGDMLGCCLHEIRLFFIIFEIIASNVTHLLYNFAHKPKEILRDGSTFTIGAIPGGDAIGFFVVSHVKTFGPFPWVASSLTGKVLPLFFDGIYQPVDLFVIYHEIRVLCNFRVLNAFIDEPAISDEGLGRANLQEFFYIDQ